MDNRELIQRLLTRLAALRDQLATRSALTSREGRGKPWVGKVIDGGSKPTTVPAVYQVNPVAPMGAETEGATVTRTVDTGTVLAVIVLGPDVPGLGAELDVEWIGHRAVAHYWTPGGGGGTGNMPCCPENPPTTLYMHVTNPVSGLIEDCTLVWGPHPNPAFVGVYVFVSTGTFYDPFMDADFYYVMGCFPSGPIPRLQRWYPTTVFGDWFVNSVYHWIHCHSGPFSLDSADGEDETFSVPAIEVDVDGSP